MFSLQRRAAAACVIGVLGIAGLQFEQPAPEAIRTLGFDVAMDGSSFSFEGPVNQNGVPAAGTPFIIEGYIYPAGTFDAHGPLSGVLPNGDPEFPNLVIGNWICRGWHLQDGDAVTGPVVATTQIFDFDLGASGSHTITSEGIELADFDVCFNRTITGGTGDYAGVSGQHLQVYVGGDLNVSGGFNTSFEFDFRGREGV